MSRVANEVPGPELTESSEFDMAKRKHQREFGDVIARESFRFLKSDGCSVAVEVRIGRPCQVAHDEWACPCELHGLDERYPDMRGTSSLQAMSLAMTLARKVLEDHLRRGVRISLVDDDEAVTLEYLAATFGGLGRSC